MDGREPIQFKNAMRALLPQVPFALFAVVFAPGPEGREGQPPLVLGARPGNTARHEFAPVADVMPKPMHVFIVNVGDFIDAEAADLPPPAGPLLSYGTLGAS